MVTDKYHISNKGRDIIITIIGWIFMINVIFSTLLSTPSINKPFPGFLVFENNLVVLMGLADWEGLKSGIKPRDVVVAVNGENVKNSDELYDIVSRAEPGTPLTYTIFRGNQRLEKTVLVSIFSLRDYLICYFLMFGIGFFVLFMGIFVFYVHPNSPASLSFLTVGLVTSLTTTSTFETCVSHQSHIWLYAFPMIGPLILLIGMHFPVVSSIRKYLIAFMLITTIPVILFYRLSFPDVFLYLKADTIFLLHLIALSGLGVGVMVHSFIKSDDPLTRQKGKLVVYGFTLSFINVAAVFIGVFIFDAISIFWTIASVPITLIALGYAIGKRNLFDVDTFILRSTSYFVVTGIVLVLFFILIGATSLVFQNLTGQSSQIVAVFATLLMVLIFRPLQTRVASYITKIFSKEKYEYRKTVRKAVNILANIIELKELLHQIIDTIIVAIQIEKGVIFIKDNDTDLFFRAASKKLSKDFQ